MEMKCTRGSRSSTLNPGTNGGLASVEASQFYRETNFLITNTHIMLECHVSYCTVLVFSCFQLPVVATHLERVYV